MRILHTADWHLGKTLEGRSRKEEQVKFIDELCEICDREKIDLVMVAGDIFQHFNPSAAAEEMYYELMDRLSNNGTRGIVIIAGNHDNPERLCAAAPLADRQEITLIGRPTDELFPSPSIITNRVQRVQAGPSWLELQIPGCEHLAVLAALPYPSEERLRELLSQTTDEIELLQGYNAKISHLFQQLAAHYRADTVNLAMSHLFVRGGLMSDSEQQIQMGGTFAVDPSAFPVGAQYVALGHLHRPQWVHGSTIPARYSGSPIAYSFSEMGYSKSVVILDAVPGQAPQITEIPISAGRPLVRWKATEGISQLVSWVLEGKDEQAWIELEVHTDHPITMEEINLLRGMPRDFVTIRNLLPELQASLSEQERENLPIDQMFIRYFERKMGTTPQDELLQLFLELTQTEEERKDDQEEEKVG